MKRDEDRAILRSAMREIGDLDPRTGKPRRFLKLVELAAARCGMYPSYAFGVLQEEQQASAGFRKAPAPEYELYRTARESLR